MTVNNRIHIHQDGRKLKFDEPEPTLSSEKLHGKNGYIKMKKGGWRTVIIHDDQGKELKVDKSSLIDFLRSQGVNEPLDKTWWIGTSNAKVGEAFANFKKSIDASKLEAPSGNQSQEVALISLQREIDEAKEKQARMQEQFEQLKQGLPVLKEIGEHLASFDFDRCLEDARKALEEKKKNGGIHHDSQENEFLKKFVENAHNEHLKTRMPTLKSLADGGDQTAQIHMGHAYKEGRGVEQNFEEAVRYYRLAVDQEDRSSDLSIHPTVYIDLANMYLGGNGVERDIEQAILLYQKALEKGVPEAEQELDNAFRRLYTDAGHYASGRMPGYEKDEEKAVRMYLRCLDLGLKEAPRPLAYMYQKGLGTEKNTQEAIRLYHLAIDMKDDQARIDLGRLYETGDGVAVDLNKAFDLYRASVANGNKKAMLDLIRIHEAGVVLPQELISEIEKEANQETTLGQVLRGDLHRIGLGREKNESEAVRLYQITVPENKVCDPNGEYKLGMMYENGLGGLEKDLDRAKQLYQEASVKGSWEGAEALKRLR